MTHLQTRTLPESQKLTVQFPNQNPLPSIGHHVLAFYSMYIPLNNTLFGFSCVLFFCNFFFYNIMIHLRFIYIDMCNDQFILLQHNLLLIYLDFFLPSCSILSICPMFSVSSFLSIFIFFLVEIFKFLFFDTFFSFYLFGNYVVYSYSFSNYPSYF